MEMESGVASAREEIYKKKEKTPLFMLSMLSLTIHVKSKHKFMSTCFLKRSSPGDN